MSGVNGHQPQPEQPQQQVPIVDPFNPWAVADLPMAITPPQVLDTQGGKRVVFTLRSPGDTRTITLPLDIARQLALGINTAVNNAPQLIIPTGTLPPASPGARPW